MMQIGAVEWIDQAADQLARLTPDFQGQVLRQQAALALVQAARDGFSRQAIAAVPRLRDDANGGPYVLGEQFSGADILFTTCLTGAIRRKIELPGELLDYLKRTTARAAYQRALAANQRP